MKNQTNDITNFAGENEFLANVFPMRLSYPFEFEGILYYNFEVAYQASKCEKEADRRKIHNLRPQEAIEYAKVCKKRINWEKPFSHPSKVSELCTCLKDEIMYRLLTIKFKDYAEFRDLLAATENAHIEKRNNAGDIYWGICAGQGKNKIGQMLMEIRSQL